MVAARTYEVETTLTLLSVGLCYFVGQQTFE